MANTLVTNIVHELESFSDDMQHQVWEFVVKLKKSTQQVRGIPGNQLLRFAGTIAPEDLKRMHKAIETDCDQVNLNEW